jgi:hypothetical protein
MRLKPWFAPYSKGGRRSPGPATIPGSLNERACGGALMHLALRFYCRH